MNPDTRILRKVTIDNAAEADRVFSMLMGDEVPATRVYRKTRSLRQYRRIIENYKGLHPAGEQSFPYPFGWRELPHRSIATESCPDVFIGKDEVGSTFGVRPYGKRKCETKHSVFDVIYPKSDGEGKRENTDSETLHRTDEIGNTYRLRAGANTGKSHRFRRKPVRRLSHAENGK